MLEKELHQGKNEVKQPASAVFEELSAPALEGSSLSFARKIRTNEQKELYNLRRRQFRAARAPATADAVVNRIQQGNVIWWDRVPWEEIRILVQSAAEEWQTPVSMLSQQDFNRPLEMLGDNKTIRGVYKHIQVHPEREKKNAISFLIEKLGVSVTDTDLIKHIRHSGKVMWGRIPPEARKPFLEKLAEEVGQPASMLGSEDLHRPFDLLDGKDAGGLYQHSYKAAKNEEKDAMLFLLEGCGIIATAEDVIQRMRSGHPMFWDRVSWEEVGELLKKVASVLDKPASTLGADDFRRPLEFLGGRSLGGLVDHIRQNGQQPTVASIIEKAGIEMTAEDVIASVKTGNVIPWSRVPWDVTSKLLETAAAEKGLPVSMMTTAELKDNYSFLGNRTLLGLQGFLYNHSDRENQGAISFLFERAKINISTQDIIERMKQGLPINWGRIPQDAIGNLLAMAAQEAGLPATAIGLAEIDRPLKFLNHHALRGIYGYYRTLPGGEKDTLSFLLDKTGLTFSTDGIVARMSAGRAVSWERTPWPAIKGLLNLVTEEQGLPNYMLTSTQFRQSLQFLNGHALKGLYAFCLCHPEKSIDETTVDFIRRKIELRQPIALTRANFRLQRMQDLFKQKGHTIGPDANLAVEELMPWIQSVARLYRSPFFDISKEDIESELAIMIFEEMRDGTTQTTDFVKNLHKKLEQVVRKESNKRYKEKALSTPIVEDITLEGVLGSLDRNLEEINNAGISIEMQRGLTKLSPLQRRLLYGITIEQKSFEEMEEKLSIDVDTLQEHYEDALALLRINMEIDD